MSSKYSAYKKNAVSNKEYLDGYDRIDWTRRWEPTVVDARGGILTADNIKLWGTQNDRANQKPTKRKANDQDSGASQKSNI
jgi:hypothetical protein